MLQRRSRWFGYITLPCSPASLSSFTVPKLFLEAEIAAQQHGGDVADDSSILAFQRDEFIRKKQLERWGWLRASHLRMAPCMLGVAALHR